MARQKKPEEPSAGSPWLNTFADLMNLLLCFFVLLFAASTVDADKYENIAASMSNNFSILNSGGSGLDEGRLISSGISQMNNLDAYTNNVGKNEDAAEEDNKQSGESFPDSKTAKEDALDALLEQKKEASQKMYEKISEMSEKENLNEYIELDIAPDYQYIKISLSGSILFDSGKSDIKKEALPILSKVGDILRVYKDYHIELEGHTDNIPIHNSVYPSNNWLSSARALNAAMYLVEEKGLNPKTLSWTGRGEYDPVVSNATSEGRAKNRRVEIKIYNK